MANYQIQFELIRDIDGRSAHGLLEPIITILGGKCNLSDARLMFYKDNILFLSWISADSGNDLSLVLRRALASISENTGIKSLSYCVKITLNKQSSMETHYLWSAPPQYSRR